MSYFPNWQVSGAEGPYRITPNHMVVVPTSEHVELTYGWTGVDIGSYALSFAGIGGAVLLARRPRRRAAGEADVWLDGPDPVIDPAGELGAYDDLDDEDLDDEDLDDEVLDDLDDPEPDDARDDAEA
jgi:hypothetical protein